MIRANRQSFTLLVALILGWASDQLFYNKALGISVFIFALLLIITLFGLGWLRGAPPTRRNLWLLLPLIFFTVMVFARANPFLVFLNVTASLALLGLLAHFYAAGRVESLGLLGYPVTLLRVGANAIAKPAFLVSDSVDMETARKQGGRNLLPILRGLLLALPVLIVFTLFLASADLVFANYLEDFFHLDFLPDFLEWLWRGIIIGGVAWVLAGGLVYALKRSHRPDDAATPEKTLDRLPRIISLGFIETTTVLVLVSLLFLLFGWIQFAYLFGGQVNIAVEGYTYADYARRGFFELIAVSALTMGLILSLHQITRRETGRQAWIFNGLSSFIIVLVLVILASAFQRLLLYEATYGYTQLRLYSHIFMIWLAATFLWFLIILWRWPSRFAFGAFLAVLGFLITLNIINPDAFIAEQNLARYQAAGKLDVYYLTTLSEDAAPILISAVKKLSGKNQEILSNHLRDRLAHLEANARSQGWPSFHLARWRAHKLLLKNQLN